MNDKNVRKLVLAAVCVALGLVLPLLTGQIPEIGSKLCPMHIPILLCGFLCGWQYGLVAGFITPLLRSVIFSMPPMIGSASVRKQMSSGEAFRTFLLPQKGHLSPSSKTILHPWQYILTPRFPRQCHPIQTDACYRWL